MWIGDNFPNFRQSEQRDCGPTCLKIVAAYHDRHIPIEKLRTLSKTSRIGTTLSGLSEAAEAIGLQPLGVRSTFREIAQEPIYPFIAHWQGIHFVVVYKFHKGRVYLSDPAIGLVSVTESEFLLGWIGRAATEDSEGNLLVLETTPDFFTENPRRTREKAKQRAKRNALLKSYLKEVLVYKKYFYQIILGFIAGSVIQVIIPFFTQSIVDVGIQNKDIDFIYLIMGSQVCIYVVMTAMGFARGWILLHINTRINVTVTTNFFIKLMNLPMSYFDVRLTGDVMQRITDLGRIERLFSIQTISLFFSFFNFFIFGGILAYYNTQILMIFLIGTSIYLVWVLIFLKRRKILDHRRFAVAGKNSSKIMELINSIQDIKLNNAENQRRGEWEKVQVKYFGLNIDSLKLSQTQGLGSSLINQIKNLTISLISAKLVIDGDITLGMMFAISYIVGQLNSPISMFIGFINTLQDARLSLDRINEVYDVEEEEQPEKHYLQDVDTSKNITIQNLSFGYGEQPVLHKFWFDIPANKVTAVVGSSGSGKTTLLKLLLKFYEPQEGRIMLGQQDLANIAPAYWRKLCGVVMQESVLFNDTVTGNIAVDGLNVNDEQVIRALKLVNLWDYVSSLPAGLDTVIGQEGVNMSTGQKQRLMIARAIYKDTKFVFLDEATSALDANNEKKIMENLKAYFPNRTVLVIAHRLSTVKKADQIIVLENGVIEEKGTHEQLLAKKGSYYTLVKNQLELDA